MTSRPPIRLTAEIILGLACFALVAWTLGHFAGVPDAGDFSKKLDWLDAHAGSVDVVVVGSSRVQRGLVPAAFDAAAASRDLAVRSFNLGVAGMEPAEADAVVRHLAKRFADRDERPRWLLIEVAAWDVELEVENRFKARAIFWHDAAATRTALRALRDDDEPADPAADTASDETFDATTRRDLATTHLLHWATRTSGAGRGPDLVARLLCRRTAPAVDAFPEAGYDRYSAGSYETHRTRRAFLDHVDAYRHWLEPRLAVAPGVAVDSKSVAPAWVADAWARQVAAVRAAGIEPIYIVPPTPRPPRHARRLAADGVLPALLAFDDPAVHGDLFAVERRFDLEHLTHDGAIEWSRRLGLAFAEHVAPVPRSQRLAERAAPRDDAG